MTNARDQQIIAEVHPETDWVCYYSASQRSWWWHRTSTEEHFFCDDPDSTWRRIDECQQVWINIPQRRWFSDQPERMRQLELNPTDQA